MTIDVDNKNTGLASKEKGKDVKTEKNTGKITSGFMQEQRGQELQDID